MPVWCPRDLCACSTSDLIISLTMAPLTVVLLRRCSLFGLQGEEEAPIRSSRGGVLRKSAGLSQDLTIASVWPCLKQIG